MSVVSEGRASKISCSIMIRYVVFIFVVMVFIQACSVKSVKKVIPFVSSDSYLQLTLKASDNINPNQAGRSSPLNVKTYLLSSRTTFDNLRFDAAFSQAKTLLDEELLSKKEYIFQPGESKKYKIKISEDAKFVVVLAAYRDLEDAKWKVVLPLEDESQTRIVELQANSVFLQKEKETDDDEILDVVEDNADQFVADKMDSELEKVF